MRLIIILQKKKILDDKDMEEIFGKPEETRLIDCYKIWESDILLSDSKDSEF